MVVLELVEPELERLSADPLFDSALLDEAA